MKFQWREGAHPPKALQGDKEVAIDAEAVIAVLHELPEPSPECLLEASKEKQHLLNYELWHEGDQVWASRGRLARCRTIIGAVHEVVLVGGHDVTIRAVEFVRTEGEGRWAHIEAIRNDVGLEAAYLIEISRLQQQALAKLEKYRALKAGG